MRIPELFVRSVNKDGLHVDILAGKTPIDKRIDKAELRQPNANPTIVDHQRKIVAQSEYDSE